MEMSLKSNIQPLSNVFPLKKGLLEDQEFHDQVKGKKAIDIMVDRLKRHTGEYKPLTPEQKNQSEEGMYCALLGDKKELVFGFVQVDGKLKPECRCYKHTCSLFKTCRPDYDLSVLPRPFNHDLVRNPLNREEESRNQGTVTPPIYPSSMGTREIVENSDILIDFSEDDFDYVVDLGEKNVNPQESVIQAMPDSKMLVMAGPGTGKTYTLLKRLEYLIQNHKVDLNNIIVLSFSRAAIAEIRQRTLKFLDVNEFGYNVLQDVDIRTFDSFATFLLKVVEPELDLTGKDYDTRIEMAIECIYRHPDVFDFTQHIIVDEIQDLVGARARLVQTILKHSDCGFTFLGDPCQAIYEYQVADSPNEPGSLAFLEWLMDNYGESLLRYSFDYNYRQSKSLAKIGQQVRKSLLEGNESKQVDSLLKAINSFRNLGRVQDLATQVTFDPGRKYALLCRDNGKVLKVSKHLRDKNIAHSVQRPSTQKLLDRWLGEVLGGFTRRFMDFDEFSELSNRLGPVTNETIHERWATLKRVEKGHGSRIDMETLFNEISNNFPLYSGLELTPYSNVVVSSIHRAKGREYDEVILLENDIVDRSRWNDISDEVRTYYVALTRPKENLYLCNLDTGFQRKVRDRWIYTRFSRTKKKPYITNVEIGLEKDIEISSFVDVNLHGSEETVLNNQVYICHSVRPGDPVVLVKSRGNDGGVVKYNILHDGNCIGSMSNSFSDDLFQALREVQGFYSKENYEFYPSEINEVYIDDVCSYVLPTAASNVPDIYRRSRIWNGVYLTGLGHLNWTN
ncbi:Superfamily I DNA and RNA helicases [Paenibacillus barengoltzii J12]|uniref:DNA 3'-5' helicase n=2 Tax=Paenibacillus barengoltzii TaxID=343517 RepID=A0ABY1LYF8_9BACL|nr:Superfamily I DNA and RNA helicases [Paenibacillus barengoltzii J12]